MKIKFCYGAWAVLYVICAGLGFADHAAGFGKVLLILSALIFFLPGFFLLADGIRTGNGKRLRLLRIFSGVSLGLTLAVLVANFLSVGASAAVGDILYLLLRLVSVPMLCGQYWVISLFLWACLLVGTLVGKRRE